MTRKRVERRETREQWRGEKEDREKSIERGERVKKEREESRWNEESK